MSTRPRRGRQGESSPLHVGLALVTLLLIAYGLRVWHLGRADLTFDEVATVYVAHRTIPNVIRYVTHAAREHPPVYYMLMAPWLRTAGTEEFTVRYPSVLVSLLAIAWGFRFARRLLGTSGGMWFATLLTVAPFSVWVGRNGRMYALVMLLAIMTMDSWWRYLRKPSLRRWLVLLGVNLFGPLTHYYLALLWVAEGSLLILLPKRTRTARWRWTATLAGITVVFGLFVLLSPGVRAMVLDVMSRFPAQGSRITDLKAALGDLYLWGYRPELAPWVLVACLLTALGWILAWYRDPLAGALGISWTVIPLGIVLLIPEAMASRYLTPIFPALMLGLAALVISLRRRTAQLITVLLVFGWTTQRIPVHFQEPDTTFSQRMALLHAAAQRGDALIMNGPWPSLLLTYYRPPDGVFVYRVPRSAPPGFQAEEDIPLLRAIFAQHSRVWVSYGAIHWADPEYSVSRWLAENAHCVFEYRDLYLCTRVTTGAMRVVAQDLSLGEQMRLVEASVDRGRADLGDIVRVRLVFEGESLDTHVGVTLALLDNVSQVWQDTMFNMGPAHHRPDLKLPPVWSENRGMWLLPGTPPGQYTLGLHVEGEGIVLDPAVAPQGWIPLDRITVTPERPDSRLLGALPNHNQVTALFTDRLALVGLDPMATRFTQGYIAGFSAWWYALSPPEVTALEVRLLSRTQGAVHCGAFPLAPSFYPVEDWRPGDTVRQMVFFQLPDTIAPGPYIVQARAIPDPGRGEVPPNPWHDLFTLQVEARRRIYHPPLFITHASVNFGGILRLRGYQLERKEVYPGDQVQLTVYWEALQRPDRVYAVFNHLRSSQGELVWQGDSWPQAGIYTTNHWLKGEVVAETYQIDIPPNTPPGSYPLYTGVYVPQSGERLTATDRSGEHLVNDEVILFWLEVLP